MKWSRKNTWIKSLSARWSRSSIVTRRPSPGASFGSLLSFLTPGFCSQWPQTDLAADLPGPGWLKCDHTSGSPAFSLWKHKHDLLSPFFPTSQKYKEPFLPSAPFSLTQRQAGKFDGWWFRIVIWERPLTAGKEDSSSAHLTKYKPFKTCFSHNVTCIYTYITKKFKPKDSHWKASLPPPPHPSFPPQRQQPLPDYFAFQTLDTFQTLFFTRGFRLRERNQYLPSISGNARP